MRGLKFRSGVNWQWTLQQKFVKKRATSIYKTCATHARAQNHKSNMESFVRCKVWWHTKLKSKAIPIQVWTRSLRLQEAEVPIISRYSAHEGGKSVSPMYWLPLLPRRYLVLIFGRGWVDPRATLQPGGFGQLKIPMTPLGIKPTTFRPIVQCLNQQCHRIPLIAYQGWQSKTLLQNR